jgi:hypothetical protein
MFNNMAPVWSCARWINVILLYQYLGFRRCEDKLSNDSILNLKQTGAVASALQILGSGQF